MLKKILNLFCWVNAYEVNQRYGGPEEGGWWYETGKKRRSLLILDRFGWALKVAQWMEKKYPRYNKRTHRNDQDQYSINYSGGDHRVRIQKHRGRDYPDRVPYYE